ncbi:MAG: phosphoribosyl-AMP cyclohydrolase [Pirellulaceae bacterium]
MNSPSLPDGLRDDGLVAAIAQDASSQQVLMIAWMNREAFEETCLTGFATYYRRSRKRLWRKGEESGHRQRVLEIRVDCDQDAVLLLVEQQGAACHEGYASCFFRSWTPEGWHVNQPQKVDPSTVYGDRKP